MVQRRNARQGCKVAAAMIALPFLQPPTVHAQQSTRPSLAGSLYEESRKPQIDVLSYNLKLGPVAISTSAGLDLEFDDNVALSENHRKSDLIFEPHFGANVYWTISPFNSLRVDLALGYRKYLENSQYDTSGLTVAPNSQLAFDVYMGNFRFTFFDRFSLQQDPASEINLSSVATFERLENAAGLSVTWDLNKIILFGTYTHYNYETLSSQFSFLNRSEEQLNLSAAFFLNENVTTGFRATAALVNYDQNVQNGGFVGSVGPFVDTHLTRYLTVSAEAGYQGAAFDKGGLNNDHTDLNGFYARVNLEHRLNQYWTESLAFIHEADIGFTSNFTELTGVRYGSAWRVNSHLTLNLNAYYEHGQDSGGTFQKETIDRFGASVGFGYALSRKLTLSFAYQWIDRVSDLVNRSYQLNRLIVGLNYAF